VLARYAPHRRAASKRPLLLGNHDGPKRPASGAASTRGGSPSIRQSARRCRRPELRIPDVAAQTRIGSVAGIRLDHRKSVRPFKGIFCHDISEFESYMPSQAVRSLWAMSRSQRRQKEVCPRVADRPATLPLAEREQACIRARCRWMSSALGCSPGNAAISISCWAKMFRRARFGRQVLVSSPAR